MLEAKQRCVVWQFCDGKPGHERQSDGLIAAIADRIDIDTYRFDAKRIHVSWRDFICRRFAAEPPTPNLVIGAGRRCQWPMLCAKRAYGAKLIYLMRPQWPGRWFDLCLIPRHDAAIAAPNIIVTDGVLNDIRPAAKPANELAVDPEPLANQAGLILIGGPSDHVAWDDDAVFRQLKCILAANRDQRWLISDSRRTPAATRARLAALINNNVSFIAAEHCKPGWLQASLAAVASAWVTSDSVSMVYECLSAGVALGIVEIPAPGRDRINSLIEALVAEGRVTRFSDWENGSALARSTPLNEATRCAKIVIERFALSERA